MVDTLINTENIAVGNPLLQTVVRILSLYLKYPGWMEKHLLFFIKYQAYYKLARIFPIVVAIAAPAAPI